jgi:hypothetical protein
MVHEKKIKFISLKELLTQIKGSEIDPKKENIYAL